MRAQAHPRREGRADDKKKTVPIEEKESFSWILGLRDCMDVSSDMPHTRLICVMDREADFFELFDALRESPVRDTFFNCLKQGK
jgi:hypothetical protein